MEAKCNDCCGGYVDGKKDCEIEWCPLYSFMPYRKKEPIYKWLDKSPRRVQRKSIVPDSW